ncbi:family 12 putative glycoside hydrolase [Cladorrhinum sp. PSN259]|nr:family 12 putative glycoside hydrolase [Cladorrhinum sp. PSN259]
MRCLSRAIFIVLWVKHTASRDLYDATVCDQKTYTSPSGDLTFVPNAWNPDPQGFQCMSVRDSPPAFDATWQWPSNPETVHSYPHVKLNTPASTVTLSNISHLSLAAQWSMGTGSSPYRVASVDSSGLEAINVIANVAFDIFADRNPANAHKEVKAETEIMIWLGRFGNPQPLGFNDTTCCGSQVVNDVEFNLFRGRNQRGTDVFTWIAETNQMVFAAEISPLLQHLWRNGFMSENSHVGLISFGTEAYFSMGNVTFSASEFDMCLETGKAPTLPANTTCSKKSSSPRIQGSPWLSGMTIFGTLGAVLYIL